MSSPKPLPLAAGISQSFIDLPTRNLRMHILSANLDTRKPLILLLHGFPELAYVWRKVIAPLSQLDDGYCVVAPDKRGYGQTTLLKGSVEDEQAWLSDEDVKAHYNMGALAEDVLALVDALGYKSVSLALET